MAAKSTVWPIYLIGMLCFAIAGTVAAVTLFVDWTLSPGQELAIALPFLSGLAAFRAGFAERRRQRALMAEAAPPSPPRRKRARLEPPPRIGDDPFRNPPGAPPIVVERPPVHAAAPIVPGDPSLQPKLLT
jgi:hypothetical protein